MIPDIWVLVFGVFKIIKPAILLIGKKVSNVGMFNENAIPYDLALRWLKNYFRF